MTVNYPPEVTPLGEDMVFDGVQPMMGYRSYDGNVVFHLMGGLAPWPGVTEGVLIKDIKGFMAPWKLITQKGATQDGVTVLDALYDPIEIDMNVVAVGNTPQSTRQVVRDWQDSWDAKQKGELFCLTHEMGHWWAPVRWLKSPLDKLNRATANGQELGMVAQADNGFWRTYSDVDSFNFVFDSMSDAFTFTNTSTLGANWPLYYYEGAGAGHPAANGTQATWVESGTTARGVVIGPYAGFDTDTDNQVITIELGTIPETVYAAGAYNDIWGRMGVIGGAWDGNGIRARIGRSGFYGWVELARFNNFVKTVLYSTKIGFRPRRGEKFSLVCGIDGNPRMFRIMRNSVAVLSHKETGTGSHLGSAYRGVGFGMVAGAGTSSQASPAWVTKIRAGDNAAVTQSGFFTRTNIGDQPMYDDYTVFGPFTKLRIWDGPNAGANDYVEFGPLLANQGALLRTDPRDRNVYDLATVPAVPNQQEKGIFDAALDGLLSFASAANVDSILSVIQSIFGIFGGGPAPPLPQGNMYSLLKGRFSDRSAIPAKSPARPAAPVHVKVEMVGGTADSKVIANGIPLRRYPM